MLVNQLPRAMRRAQFFVAFCLTTMLVGGVLLGAAGCANPGKPAASAKRSASPTPSATPRVTHFMVGEIAVVNETERFVLVDLGAHLYVPPPGELLQTTDATGTTAHLKASPEQKRPFIAADIVDGTPKVGDEVLR